MRFSQLWIGGLVSVVLGIGCGNQESSSPVQSSQKCATLLPRGAIGSTGTAQVFNPDPMSSSNNFLLSPLSPQLNQFLTPVELSHLTGQGVLKGSLVQVLNGVDCSENFGAFDPQNQFVYPHGDRRFQEAMTYHFADRFQSQMSQSGYLPIQSPVELIAHCDELDNAYFERMETSTGQILNRVCLGDSSQLEGASYSDDGLVTVHELQHANTVNLYSATQDLNQFWYDEAGAMNEAVSDFMGLVFADQLDSPVFSLDPKVFSRWALGRFDPQRSHVRGAHRCPIYDSSYPTCDQFPAFRSSTDANGKGTSISYVYPDGLGWPYTKYYDVANPALEIYEKYALKEEIHDAGVLLEGALWDVYAGIKENHPGDVSFASQNVTKLLMESIRHLPQPNYSVNASPVNYIGLASNLVTYSKVIPELTTADQATIQKQLKARGLYDFPRLTSKDWLAIGSGTNIHIPSSRSPGVRIVDNPDILRKWLKLTNRKENILDRNLTLLSNSQFDPGEVAAVWFDLQNNSDISAGGVLLTVTLDDPDVMILNGSVNRGYLSSSMQNKTQVMYAKINGNSVVKSLNSSQNSFTIPAGNTYFKTNPRFDQSWTTAVWVRVLSHAPHGKTVYFNVTAQPANGVESTQVFPVVIN